MDSYYFRAVRQGIHAIPTALLCAVYPPRPRRLGGGFGRVLIVGRLAGAARVLGLDIVGRAPLAAGLARVVIGRDRDTVGLDQADGERRVTGALRVTGARRGCEALG